MSVNPQLRTLDIAIPAKPEALVRLSLLMAEDDLNLAAIASLIETDMALAAAVLKAVNSSLYGLEGRVQSVQQAITYLGLREIAAITFELGLRAAFPPAAELESLWQRAGRRGHWMGRLAQRLGQDAWAAHSAGLFEECGKAILFRHAADHYAAMLRATADDAELLTLERAGFGVSHDALGAAMCESWGLDAAAVASVRHHVAARCSARIPEAARRQELLAVTLMVGDLLDAHQDAEQRATGLAAQVGWAPELVLRMCRQLGDEIAAARQRGRT